MSTIFSDDFNADATGWSLASTVERRSGDSSVTGNGRTGTDGFRDTDGSALVLRGKDVDRHATTPTISTITAGGTIGVTARSNWAAPYMSGTNCAQTSNSYTQGSQLCIADNTNYMLLMGNINNNVHPPHHSMWMCEQNMTCGGPTATVMLIKARYQP